MNSKALRSIFIKALNWVFYLSGLSRFLRTKDKICLLYHRVNLTNVIGCHFARGLFVSAEQFEKQMRFLSRFNNPGVSITFDDGYKDNFLYAYPILKKYGQKAIFFVSSGFLDGYYFQTADVLNAYARKNRLGKREFKKLRRAIRSTLSQRVELISTLRVNHSELAQDHAMNWADLGQLLTEGHTVGNHTVNHPVLAKESVERITYEIAKCTKDIREHLNADCTYFAYPYGKLRDIPPGIEKTLKENGIDYAFTTVRGCYKDGDNPFFIRRIPIFYGDDLATFANKCYGITLEDLRLKVIASDLWKLFRSLFG